MRDDPELMSSLVRLNLLRKNFTVAQEWTDRLKKNPTGPPVLVRLGGAFERARMGDAAAGAYQQALDAAFYPEALLGLSRIELQRKNLEQARSHALAALNLERPVGEQSATPVQLFHTILQQLTMLEEPRTDCHAWIARLDGKGVPAILAKRSLIVVAPERRQATRCVHQVLEAMHPTAPPLLPTEIGWRDARNEQQPDGPIRPGIHAVTGG